ncbi:transporter substrate-binding domain-containing protein [Legionella cincinnatiensis]|uniref:Glutamine ABC transporter n=1 Tax=Legionella cincinnatiensis TaxID=28085 RepID=A0A378ITV4_9GAMM|nr:transporter substrate-binding domain-containing protein [Legionella cincinnatiensis]KTC89091.1 glutamine ABC transporter [Legionella cincinnatiensis]STX35444.1 glutamine ABC transporter [Legionella cincinnatiensis]
MMLFISTLSYCNPLKVGVAVSGLPISEKVDTADGPYYFGFCIDLMNEICERIDKKCTYREITLSNQFEVLRQGKIDLLILPRPYTSLDFTQYAMSVPYAVSKIQFIALRGSPINKVTDIKNKKIGVIKNTFYSLLTQSPYHNSNQIIPYNSNSDLILNLVHHKIDVIALNNALAYILLNNNYYDIKLVGSSLSMGDGYGIIALPDKEALIKKINGAILSIEKDGSYVSIYQKYYAY